MVEVGQPAPDFELPDQNGEPVTLSSLRGQKWSSISIPRPIRRADKAVTMATTACRPSASGRSFGAKLASAAWWTGHVSQTRPVLKDRLAPALACEAQISLPEPSLSDFVQRASQ